MNLKDDKEDFFDGPDIPEIPKQPKMPELKPEDPDYWEQPESEFEHLKPKRKDWRMWAGVALAGVVIGVACDTLFARGFPTYIIAGAVTIVVCALTQAFGPVFLYDFEFSVLRHIMIFQCVYSMLFLLPVYIMVRSISRIPGAS